MAEPMLPLQQRPWTAEDLQQIDDDAHRYEIVEGDLLVMAPPTNRHNVLAARLIQILNGVLPAGTQAYPPLGVQMGRTVRVPDVVVVEGDPLARPGLVMQGSDVLLVVEVQSPSTARTDRLMKPYEYAQAGIAHYWRLDPDDGPTLTVAELEGEVYREVGVWRGDEQVVVEAPVALRFRPSDLLRHR